MRPLMAAIMIAFSCAVHSQETIDKEVVVVRPFEPSVIDASKINLLPSLTDTISILPVFSYTIMPMPLASDFEVEPITPARMSAESVSKLYSSYLRLGMGSYVSPFAELSINSLRNSKYNGGLYLLHHSSQGKIKLDNDEKAFSQFSDSEMLFYGKRMGRRNVLSGEAGLKSNGFHFYGYDTALDTVPEKDDLRQNFMSANAGLSIKSTNIDSSRINYNLGLYYNYFQDRLDVAEHAVSFRTGLSQYIRGQVIGADIEADYYDNTFFADTSSMVLKVSPWFNKADEEWEVFAGFHGYYEQLGDESGLYFHPRASLQFSIIRNYVIPYVGIDGRLNVNNYSKMAYDNRFIVPGLFVKNSNTSMDIYTGVKGNFTREVSFNFMVSYAVTENMHFFVNDYSELIGNRFLAVYDDVEVLNYSGEIGAIVSNRLSLLARANYYSYEMKLQEHPWHKPALDIRFSANYNLRDKILLNADVYYTGKRFARLSAGDPGDPGESGNQFESIELKGIADFNIGIEYRYNKILSGFLRLNNLANNTYYKWNHYPVQGFTLMAGFTYSL